MQLDSYLEIFLTAYGWAFANVIGDILVGTGLAILPFGIIVFRAWYDSKEKGQGFEGIRSLLESIETKLISAMFVMATCFATTPYTSLSNLRLSYMPQESLTNRNPELLTKDSNLESPSVQALTRSYQKLEKSGSLSSVPAWWYAVMGLSSGINGAFRAGVGNATSEIRMVEDVARTATIEDTQLLRSIQRFYSECFVPARSQYIELPKGQLTAAGQAIIAPENKDYGLQDPDWMGSQLYRTEPGFYDEMRSYNPVPGWSINFARDVDYIQTPAPEGDPHHGYVNPDWGRPTCKEWWEDETIGIRAAMAGHTSRWRALTTEAMNVLSSADKAKDAVARLAQSQARPQYVSPDSTLSAQHDGGTVLARAIGGVVSTAGTGVMALLTNITVVPLHNGLLMVQAMVLMSLYMLMPLIIVLSGYDLRAMWLGGIAIFTVKLWSVMWFVVNWVDGHLMAAMYPSFNTDYLVQMLQNGNKRMLLNVLLMTMYLGMPAVWSGLMAMVGIRSAEAIGGMLNGAGRTAENTAPKRLR